MNVEGRNQSREAIENSKNIDKVIVQDKTGDKVVRELVSLARSKGLRVEFAPKEALDRISQTHHHQGIITIVSDFEYTPLDDILKEDGRKFLVLLDKISDPHNLGSILRSAECAGVSAVVIPSRNSVLVNETVIRTSAGATSHVKVCKVNNLNDAIKQIKNANIFVYATDMNGKSMYETNLKGNIAIIIGSEGDGVSALTKKLADEVIKIPMKGKLNSLNASVAAGIVMFEVLRQGE